jgi:NADP-dependent 3-hydroxy acid dehydrogenase YdfG
MAKTVLITGSCSGIGRATAQLFALRGWNVAATARNPDSLASPATANNVMKLPLDVTN